MGPESEPKSIKTLPGPPPEAGPEKDIEMGRPKSRRLSFYLHENIVYTEARVPQKAPEMSATLKCGTNQNDVFQTTFETMHRKQHAPGSDFLQNIIKMHVEIKDTPPSVDVGHMFNVFFERRPNSSNNLTCVKCHRNSIQHI